MAGLKKRAAKRLKISTGDDRAGGATAKYASEMRRAERMAAAKGKSEEEKQLEEQLFGSRHAQPGEEGGEGDYDGVDAQDTLDWLGQKRKNKLRHQGEGQEAAASDNNDGEEEEDLDELDTGLSGVADDQLFFTDAPGPSSHALRGDRGSDDEEANDEDGGEDEYDEGNNAMESDEEDEDQDKDEDEPPSSCGIFDSRRAPTTKKALWHDPSDANLQVSLANTKRLRKLRGSAAEDVISGTEYEQKLREQFRKINPTPSWATKAREQKRKGKGIAEGSDASDDDDDDDDEGDSASLARILQDSSAGLQRTRAAKVPLPAGEIDVTRLRDANHVDKSKSSITTLQFHPTAQVMYTTSDDRRLRLFQIDGSRNPLLQAIHVPELPITSSAFHPTGSSILLTGLRPFFYSFDLQAGRIIRSPRGLWSSGLGGSDRMSNDKKGGSMELFKFSPDGRMLAVAGRRGYVHLLDWGSDGNGMMAGGNGGQVVGQVKVNTGVKGLAWNANGTELVTVGDDAAVYNWDVGTRKCISRWTDDGGFAPSAVEMDRSEKYLAIGSRSGIVNLYNAETAFSSGLSDNAPRKPLKAILNLTTNVTTMRYNPTSEILALASRTNADSLKLLHLSSGTVFANWPTANTPLGHVNAVDFSRASEYIAIGNHKGRVLLYTLGHYTK